MSALPARPLPFRPVPIDDKRRSKRLKVFLLAEVVIDDRAMRVHVLDISSFGALLHTGNVQDPSKSVALRLKEDLCVARIVWAGSGRIGLAFQPALSPDQIAAVLAS